jgi:large subunit ribosomal protein L9
MSKEILLIADVDGVGIEGDVVRVADGFARNYLLPRKLAAAVNKGTRRLVERKKLDRIARQTADEETARRVAAQLAGISVTLTVKIGEGGKLFGSVTASDVLDSLKQQGIELDKKQLEMTAPIRELGVYSLPVKLHTGVDATLKVWVVEE